MKSFKTPPRSPWENRELIVERTRAVLEVAKQLGRKGGRKPKMTDKQDRFGQEASGYQMDAD